LQPVIQQRILGGFRVERYIGEIDEPDVLKFEVVNGIAEATVSVSIQMAEAILDRDGKVHEGDVVREQSVSAFL